MDVVEGEENITRHHDFFPGAAKNSIGFFRKEGMRDDKRSDFSLHSPPHQGSKIWVVHILPRHYIIHTSTKRKTYY